MEFSYIIYKCSFGKGVMYVNKPGKIVLKETAYIAKFELAFSVILQLVFVLVNRWDYTVILGNILSGIFAVANFLFMGISVENAVSKDEKQARSIVKASQTIRQLVIFVVAASGVILPCFNNWTVLLPLFFPRIAISLRPLFGKNK